MTRCFIAGPFLCSLKENIVTEEVLHSSLSQETVVLVFNQCHPLYGRSYSQVRLIFLSDLIGLAPTASATN
jgi:hypothetical protein